MVIGFTTTNIKKKMAFMPTEDSFSINSGKYKYIFAVADGVTRDPCEYLPDTKTLKGQIEFALKYQRPSPAKIVADLFTKTSQEVLGDYNPENINEDTIRDTFKEGNWCIHDLSCMHNFKRDYLVNDFAGCVASIVVQNDGLIHWGYICDCGVALFDEKGNLKFRTEDQSPHKLDRYFWQDPEIKGKTWENPDVRKRIRSHYRNNPTEKHSFGVLTGEISAVDYVRTGTFETRPNEHLIVYSDGLEQVIFSGEFADKLKENDVKGMKKLCKEKVKTEGTLIYSKIEE